MSARPDARGTAVLRASVRTAGTSSREKTFAFQIASCFRLLCGNPSLDFQPVEVSPTVVFLELSIFKYR